MNRLGLFLYRIFVVPAGVVSLPFLALFNSKIAEGLRRRRFAFEPLLATVDPIWIHAASGEFEYAKAVIRELKTRHPGIPVVVSYFSPTFAKAAEQFPGVDLAVALPLDLPSPCRAFLRRVHPRLLLVARTDLWPEMLEQCRQRRVPVVLFSYTQKALRSPLKKIFTRWILHWVNRIYCVAGADSEHLLGLNRSCEVLGDTRYDQVAYRLGQPKPIDTSLRPPADVPCLVAGSTWPEDEAVLLPALADDLRVGRLKLILVPHEPTVAHIGSLKAKLESMGLTYSLFSRGAWDGAAILLVDQVGYLAELYAWGTFAFIGGSFRKTVHSVMEALGAGLMTFVGPKHENNREAMDFKTLRFQDFHGIEVVRDGAQLQAKIAQALQSPTARAEFRDQLLAEFRRRQGASRKLVETLNEVVAL